MAWLWKDYSELPQDKIDYAVNKFSKMNMLFETRLIEGATKYLAGENLTIADFQIFSLYCSWVINEGEVGPSFGQVRGHL